jgi:hypothetical protein
MCLVENIQLRCCQTRRTLLLLSTRRRERLSEVEFRFGIRELLRPFDLQAPAFVGSDVCNEDRFSGTLNPDRGLHLGGHLRCEYHVA